MTISLAAAEYDWLRAEAERAGVTMGAVVRAVLDAARDRGWQVEPQPGAKVTE